MKGRPFDKLRANGLLKLRACPGLDPGDVKILTLTPTLSLRERGPVG